MKHTTMKTETLTTTLLSTILTCGFVLGVTGVPVDAATTNQYTTIVEQHETQTLTITKTAHTTVVRDAVTVVVDEEWVAEQKRLADEAAKKELDIKRAAEAKLKPAPVTQNTTPKNAPPAGQPEPGSAKEYAKQAVASKGWSDEEYSCLVSLWQKESGWNHLAKNKSSGAYGIPQSLPGSKMGSAGADWETNYETQINWGLGYISGRYTTPCNAWNHSGVKGWY